MSSGSEKRQRTFQAGVRLTSEELDILIADQERTGKSPGELLREAYFQDRAEEYIQNKMGKKT
jgi:hypothetical protein